MSSSDETRPALRQLLWIAAGVAVLTLLVVSASWLFSPRPGTGGAVPGRGPSPLKEESVQKDTFAPETPGARVAVPPPPAATPAPEAAEKAAPSPPPAEAEVPPPAAPVPTPETKPREPQASAPAPKAVQGAFGVQVGAFGESSKATEVAHRLKGLGYAATVVQKDGRFKVIATGFATRADAERAQAALAKAGIREPFVVVE